MCDTGTCCTLFFRYIDLVKEHIELVDKNMYRDLLISPDEKINKVAKDFMAGSGEIKKILKDFTKTWCEKRTSLRVNDHSQFLKHTDELFELVLQRILDETEKLYPLVRSLGR